MSSDNKRQGSNRHGEEEGAGKKLRKDNHLDYGPDDDLPEESVENRLMWRTDDPFADWKIVIIVKSNNNNSQGDDNDSEQNRKKTTYNVHRCILARGDRRSEYFVRLFENDETFSESQDKTSRIELDYELQANVFPDLLDYMYSAGQKMSFTTGTATALYSLAKRFIVKRLENEAKKFCLEDMKTAVACGTYYEHATILQAESILVAAAEYCRDNIMYIDHRTSRLLHVRNPQFWLDLLNYHVENDTTCNLDWYNLGLHVAVYCETHAAATSPDIFKQLTDEKYLPVSRILADVAMILLASERLILGNNDEQQGGAGELSNLQIRCVEAIACKKELKNYMPWMYNHFKQLSPAVQEEILKALMNC